MLWKFQGYSYSRGGNPTRQVLETCLASIEGANYALTMSSGVAVITTLVSMLKTGDDIIIADNIYGGSTVLFREVAEHFGITVQLVNPGDLAAFQNAMKPNTKLVWVETPSNPCLDIVDLKRFSVLVKNHCNVRATK
jgi:cystathionine gamma-lyase